ncbi:retinol-binding protein 1 isoform X1 [Tamandua tetradactyla]|uniref:retinol-binding protein 1 isoform X1 n=1 Tax=Tamandua tetradactyla TaxID=48850 RepID=UPI0040546B18
MGTACLGGGPAARWLSPLADPCCSGRPTACQLGCRVSVPWSKAQVGGLVKPDLASESCRDLCHTLLVRAGSETPPYSGEWGHRPPHQARRKTTVTWDGDKLECVQRGEKEGRGWTQWIEGDELHLEMRAQGVICKQVFKKVH